jgi:hypothetical protein
MRLKQPKNAKRRIPMKKLFGMVILAICLVVLGSAAQVQIQVVPEAVSPGSEGGVAVVRQDCPTFSWTAVDWALGYRVAVFQAFGTEVAAYEEMAAVGAPLLSKEIPGRASSWTPSSEERLSTGSLYVWYVEALDSLGQGMWSKGKLFLVEVGGWTCGLAERVRKPLKEKGVSEEEINELLQEVKPEISGGVISGAAPGSVGKTQGGVGIQGLEGATNTFYGQGAGANTTGTYNTFMGAYAGYYNTTGYQNTFLGQGAGFYNTTGLQNTFVGQQTGVSNTNGYYNTMMGTYAGYYNTTGYFNTFMGQGAGFSNTTGRENTFIGFSSGISNTTGYRNTFIGQGAGFSNTAGGSNVFMGRYAGYYNTTGTSNVFMGSHAGYSNTTGYNNIFMGSYAGYSNSTGSGNVFLGHNAGYNETGDEKLYIDNTSTSTPLIYGDFGANYLVFNNKVGINSTKTVPTHLLDVGTSGAYCDGGAWVDGSSREYKENIQTLTTEEALKAFQNLEPVEFNYKENKEEKYLGFIAEDVPELVAMKDRKGLSPMDVVAVLTKVVQEQQKTISEHKKTISEYHSALCEYQKSLTELWERVGKLESRGKPENSAAKRQRGL